MDLSEYSSESLSFSGVGVQGETPQAAAAALAEALNAWAAAHAGRRVLQVSPMPVPVQGATGMAALIVHTAGSELSGELAEQVAAAVDDALESVAVEDVEAVGRRRTTRPEL